MSDSGEYWAQMHQAIEDTADAGHNDPHNESAMDELEGLRYLTRVMSSAALLELENHNPAYPRFSRMVTPWRQWGLPNPDYEYLSAPIHGDYSYRVFGRVGTGRFVFFGTSGGRTARMDKIHLVDSLVYVNDGSGNLVVGPDGEFEITVSREGRDGNWLMLEEGEGAVTARNALYDWETEEPASVFIEREGATYPAPPYEADDLGDRLDRFTEFTRDLPAWCGLAVDQAFSVEAGVVQFAPLPIGRDKGAGDDQVYGQGVYHCAADEAVILEVTPPECVYWGFQLASKHWESFDWNLRQTSLNGHQAVLDSDGAFRAVISHEDPGVPNWLDASGHTTGVVAGRYRTTDSVPHPRLTVVPFADLRDHLPADTALTSPAERSASLQRRKLAVERRFYG